MQALGLYFIRFLLKTPKWCICPEPCRQPLPRSPEESPKPACKTIGGPYTPTGQVGLTIKPRPETANPEASNNYLVAELLRFKTFWDNMVAHRTESAHFFWFVNSAAKIKSWTLNPGQSTGARAPTLGPSRLAGDHLVRLVGLLYRCLHIMGL